MILIDLMEILCGIVFSDTVSRAFQWYSERIVLRAIIGLLVFFLILGIVGLDSSKVLLGGILVVCFDIFLLDTMVSRNRVCLARDICIHCSIDKNSCKGKSFYFAEFFIFITLGGLILFLA